MYIIKNIKSSKLLHKLDIREFLNILPFFKSFRKLKYYFQN